MMKYKLLILLLFIPIFTFASTKLKGRIYSSDKEPIIGAYVFWENKNEGVVSDEYGFFEISGTPHQDHMIHVQYVGYKENVTHIHNFDNPVDIVLQESSELGEVVVSKAVAGRISSRTSLLKSEKVTIKELSRAACCSLAESFETNPSVDVAYSDAVTGAK